MKRVLGFLLSALMVLTLVVPVLAYDTPNAEAVNGNWMYRFRLDGTGPVASYGESAPSLKTKGYLLSSIAAASVTYADGAMHLANPGTVNSNFTGGTGNAQNIALGTTPTDMLIDIDAGSTIDFAAKIDNLPRISPTYLSEDGVSHSINISSSGILFGGFIIQALGSGANYSKDPTEFECNEVQAVFAKYDNAKYGTDAVLILSDINRRATSWDSGNVYAWFFNLPTDYARYTIKFDMVNNTTNFYVNGVNQTCCYYDPALGDYTTASTLDTVAICYRTKDGYSVGNAVTLCMNGPGHNSTKDDSPNNTNKDGTNYCDLYIDQFDIYNAPATPVAGSFVGTFQEEQVLNSSSADNAVNIYKDLNEDLYTVSSWADLEDAVASYEADKTGGHLNELTVYQHKNAIIAAIDALEFAETDKIYIGHTASSTNPRTGWTNDAILFTEAGYCLTSYAFTPAGATNPMTLTNWTRIVAQPVVGHPNMFRVAAIYTAGTAVTAAETVPLDGFILAMHLEGRPYDSGSQYASQEFGNRNRAAYSAMNLQVSNVLILNNVDLNTAGDSTLDTTGTWVHRYAYPAPDPTPLWRSADANPDAVEGGPQYLAKDQFDNFVSNSYITRGEDLPNFTVTVEGEGSVNATINDIEREIDSSEPGKFILYTGDAIALEAVGNDFVYWKNAKNGAIISTQNELNLTYAMSEVELTAVFQSETGDVTTQYPVTFKDGLTGKILSVVNVDAGTVVPSEDIPAMNNVYGYTFNGWYADNHTENPIESFVIEKATTFVGRYDKNNEDNLVTLKVIDGEYVRTYQRRFGSIATLNACYPGLCYWDLDGVSIGSTSGLKFSVPNHDCTITAVYEDLGDLNPSTTMLSCFVDESGTLLVTMLRDLEGSTLVESGVLMTRKATPDDLIVNTIANVTRGVSTASADKTSFGFQKTNMFSKDGTWYVRGYLSYRVNGGDVQTTYTPVYTIDVPDSEHAQSVIGAPYARETEFALAGTYNVYAVDVYPHLEEDVENDMRCYFPTVTQADDGTLIVVYYYSPTHALYNTTEGPLQGVLKMVKSTDNGATWTEPETIVDLTIASGGKRESRDPNLQKLADGTIVLTFPVRTSLDVAGMNGSASNDYWYERAYYMTSTDNGQTWSGINLIPCNYFNTMTQEEAIDANGNHKNAAGCWVKNGSMAELPNGDLLIPLYGAVNCSTRAILQSVIVKAHNNGDGTLSFYDSWAGGTDAVAVNDVGMGDELALYYYNGVVYGALRVKVSSSTPQTPGGPIIRSYDNGLTFETFTYEETINNCLNQPNFLDLGDGKVLFNYAVPRSSAPLFATNAKGTGRPVFGKVIDLDKLESEGESAWDENEALMIYDGQGSTLTNDMGNPCSYLMDNGEIITVFYNYKDKNTPSFIGARFTTIGDYVGGDETGSIQVTPIYSLDFEDFASDAVYPASGTSATTINSQISAGKINRTRDYDNSSSGYGHSELRIAGTSADQCLEFYTNNQKRTTFPVNKVMVSGDKGNSVIVSFDYNFGDYVNVDGEYHKIEMRLFDASTALARDTSTLGVKVTPGAVTLLNGSTTLKSISLSAAANTWYTCKVIYQVGYAAFKVYARGEAEPDWSAVYEVNAATVTAAEAGNPLSIACWKRTSSGTSSAADYSRSIYIDNVDVSEAALGFAGLYPTSGFKMHIGGSASAKVIISSLVPLSGAQAYGAYSDNTSVATISTSGVVTAVGIGKANIHVVSKGVDYSIPVVVFD